MRLHHIFNRFISRRNLQDEPSSLFLNLDQILSAKQIAQIDEFDRIQLEGVIEICRKSKSMADAGRRLFSVSREQRQSTNDSDRVKKYLAKFSLNWDDVKRDF